MVLYLAMLQKTEAGYTIMILLLAMDQKIVDTNEALFIFVRRKTLFIPVYIF